MADPMDDDEIAAYLRGKIDSSMNDEGDEISSSREDNLNRYLGRPDGYERAGQSQLVTRECLEAVEWAMPSLMRVFSQQNAVTMDPVGRDDEPLADQETDVVRHYLFETNDGFMALHDWAKGALMNPNGYAKIWIDEAQEPVTERYEGLTEAQVMSVVNAEGVEVLGHQERFLMLEGQMLPAFDIEIRRTKTEKTLRFEAIAPEDVLVDDDLATVDLDKANFVAHKRGDATFTDLVNDGFDADKLKDVARAESEGSEGANRRMYDSKAGDDGDHGLETYTVYECYCRLDVDGDGLAERRRIVLIGDTIFENEEEDYIPLVAMCTILMPHQHTGLSLIDLVKDIQEATTALLRQIFTNAYRINTPRKYVGERALVDGGITMDAMLDLESELIPCLDPSAIVPEVIQSLAPSLLPVLQHMSERNTMRTGINPQAALDPNVLRETTKGAFNQALSHASQRLEMIARVMAETGLKKAFRKAHRLIREHLGQKITLKMRSEWIDIDPSGWRERTAVRVNIGVGNQQREEKVQMLQQILGFQMGALQAGLPFVTPENVFNTISEMVQDLGFRDAARFVTDPKNIPPPQPPPPDPMAEVAKAQAEAMKVDAQSKMARVEAEKQKMSMQAQLDQARLQLDQYKAQMDGMKAQQSADNDRERTAMDYQLKTAELSGKDADRALKDAQRIKTLEEARKLDIENSAMLPQIEITSVEIPL